MKALAVRKQVLVADIIALERQGVRRAPDARPPVTKAEAIQLRDGERPVSISGVPDSDGERLRDLHRELAMINLCDDANHNLAQDLTHREFRERFARRGHEWTAANRAICEALLALERALHARDRLSNELKPPGSNTLPLEGHPLLGRLGRSESTIYRFLQSAVTAGVLTAAEFEKEVKNARTF
jgi:hypothetical protein